MSNGWKTTVHVKSSPIHGLGVFARRAFATGETILVREERPVTKDQPLDPENGEFEHHCDWLEGGRQVYLGFPERFVNHSCEPNAFMRRLDGESHLVALRPLRRGDEVTLHYGVNLWSSVPWRCDCGSDRCLRDLPGDFFSLPLATKIELQPLLADWFIREHAAEYQAFLQEAGLEQLVQ